MCRRGRANVGDLIFREFDKQQKQRIHSESSQLLAKHRDTGSVDNCTSLQTCQLQSLFGHTFPILQPITTSGQDHCGSYQCVEHSSDAASHEVNHLHFPICSQANRSTTRRPHGHSQVLGNLDNLFSSTPTEAIFAPTGEKIKSPTLRMSVPVSNTSFAFARDAGYSSLPLQFPSPPSDHEQLPIQHHDFQQRQPMQDSCQLLAHASPSLSLVQIGCGETEHTSEWSDGSLVGSIGGCGGWPWNCDCRFVRIDPGRTALRPEIIIAELTFFM
ncbi:unnamed protein product [Protopolystoma xenopodis]|uniref:Uncharacterized protein n=1 Tax=Protopolystoma xenopodis TaxID=117903 RepID=A0A448XBS2_9PLAT|nr:unnamed protein product [Protopolystoma xenopodis]